MFTYVRIHLWNVSCIYLPLCRSVWIHRWRCLRRWAWNVDSKMPISRFTHSLRNRVAIVSILCAFVTSKLKRKSKRDHHLRYARRQVTLPVSNRPDFLRVEQRTQLILSCTLRPKPVLYILKRHVRITDRFEVHFF